MTIRQADGTEIEAVVSSGMVEFVNNSGKIFVHSAENPADIDRVRAEEAKARAEESFAKREAFRSTI